MAPETQHSTALPEPQSTPLPLQTAPPNTPVSLAARARRAGPRPMVPGKTSSSVIDEYRSCTYGGLKLGGRAEMTLVDSSSRSTDVTTMDVTTLSSDVTQIEAQIEALTARIVAQEKQHQATAAKTDTSPAVTQLGDQIEVLKARLTIQEKWCRKSAASFDDRFSTLVARVNEEYDTLGSELDRLSNGSATLNAGLPGKSPESEAQF